MNASLRPFAPAALTLALLAAGCTPDPSTAGGGGAQADVEGLERAEMPGRARELLASGRPWRATRVMQRYLAETDRSSPEDRLLAARAEAGWGAWDEVGAHLEGLDGLESREGGVGLYLLARARDEDGEIAAAVQAYRAFLALPAEGGDAQAEARRAAARLRLGLALLAGGEAEGARRELAASAERAGPAAAWLAVLEGAALARVGDTAGVRAAVAGVDDGLLGLGAWRARVEAARRAGDHAAARGLANQARAWARTDETRSEFLVAAARSALAMGDVAAGRDALRTAIDRDPASRYAREAAELLEAGDLTPDDHLALARVLVAQGLQPESLAGYRAWIDAGGGSPERRRTVALEYANALYYSQRFDEVEAALRPIAGQTEARMLLASAKTRLGDIDEAADIYLDLARRSEGTGPGQFALFLAADARHDGGDLDRAKELYRRVVSRYPGGERSTLALMRLGGIAFLQEDWAEAARVFDAYLARSPRGSLASQATYWSGRAREEMGDSAGARERFRRIRDGERDSYYALVASRRLGVPFWPLPMGESPPREAAADARVAGWMRGVDLLRDAGFPDEASAEVDRVVDRAGSDRGTRYALAEALAQRGYAQRALRLGLALQGSASPDPRLLRILYPFPYRELVTAEATERGFDPFVAAALIRQESLFEARITSHVGARGLMQMMPATGREVAATEGLEPFDPELLYNPDINVHLGTRLLADHLQRYDGSLPAVFSAYNAGPHRVEWWSEFPEFGDDELFTERIPYSETRGYVKILTRNRALYEGLYGPGG